MIYFIYFYLSNACTKNFNLQPIPKKFYSLIDTVSRGRDPVLVQHRAAASMGAREAEERGAPDGYLPRPSTERRVLASNDPGLGSWKQWRYPALHALALGCGGDGQHRSSFRDRLGRGHGRIGFWRRGGGRRRGRGRGRGGGGTGGGGAGGGTRGGRGGFLRGSGPRGGLEVGRGDVMSGAERLVELRVLRKENGDMQRLNLSPLSTLSTLFQFINFPNGLCFATQRCSMDCVIESKADRFLCQ